MIYVEYIIFFLNKRLDILMNKIIEIHLTYLVRNLLYPNLIWINVC